MRLQVPALVFALLVVATTSTAGAQKAFASEQLAPRPPMGWNSWDSYGLTVTESQFRENVAVLARTLKPFGWNNAVIDEGWFLGNPEVQATPEKFIYSLDENGRYTPVPARFPSAVQGSRNTGFAALGAFVHAQGLKFGIHIVRGIPRESVKQDLPIADSHFHATQAADTADVCPWNATNWGVTDNAAGQAWYDSLLAQYAGWGVDFLKVDCISDHPYKPAEIRMIHKAILKTGRPIILSLSPGPTSLGLAPELLPYAQMWRVSNDIWDEWSNRKSFPSTVHDQFALAAKWSSYAREGHWPDLDMLPLGRLDPNPDLGKSRETRLTHDEQRTLMTLWCMARSPLILGANLTKLDDWTTALLTNPEVLQVNQSGHDQHQVAREDEVVAWISSGAGNVRYLSISNLADTPTTVSRTYSFYNLPATGYASRDLWTGQERPRGKEVRITLAPHASALLKLTP